MFFFTSYLCKHSASDSYTLHQWKDLNMSYFVVYNNVFISSISREISVFKCAHGKSRPDYPTVSLSDVLLCPQDGIA